MIELNVDLAYLSKYYEIGTKRISEYSGKSIEDIMKAEAANGNKKAANFDLNVLNDPKELIKVFRLFSAKNRYKILKNMNQSDLRYLMQFLEHKDLVLGLNFFTKDKLVQLMYNLPKDKIAKIMFNKFSPEKFLKMVPEKEMNAFFESTKIDKAQVMETLETFPPEILEGMMENITGQPAKGMGTDKILNTLHNLNPNRFKKAIQSLDKDSKAKLIFKLTQKDPKLFLEFSKDALMYPLKQLDKPELIKNMAVLEPDDLVKMLEELPQDLMSVVVTQIDPEVFADALCNDFQKILEDISVA